MNSYTRFPKVAHESWKKCDAFSDEVLAKLAVSLKPGTFYPYPQDIFKAFSIPVYDVRAIVVGMSPYHYTYHGAPNATGLAFAVSERPYKDYPPSLQLIADQVCVDNEESIEDLFDPTLELWADQGVLLLNAALSCLKNTPKSHMNLWSVFMQKLFQFFSDEYTPGMIYYFMGADAKQLRRHLFELGNTVLSSFHPAFHARNKKPFTDHKFAELQQAYKLMYGEGLQLTKLQQQ